jgi:glutamate carboxypeptidase
MKAGLAQIIFALRTITSLALEPPLTPLVLITSDEELGSEDSRDLIQIVARRVCRVFVPEPSTGPEGLLKTSRKGIAQYSIEVEGKSAHAGVEPETGVSAILELSHVIQALHALNDPNRGTTVNVGIVQGGSRVNMVPDSGRAEIDVRVSTEEDGRAIDQAIRSIRPRVEGARIRVTGGPERPPLEATPKNRALFEQACRLAADAGIQLGESTTGGGSDGNLTSPLTATLDGLGGVGGGAHASHEHILIDRLIERTALLALLLMAPAEGY